MKAGKVYLVGAGPGDPGLITVKGMEVLRSAEVVVFDHLLDEGLLECAPAGAEQVNVGKSGREHTMEQAEINRLLVAKAKEGKTVVRLKGGDPFVLGRGGEEAEVLVKENIPFEVVPGITSAVAVPAYAGIPVTHRTLASSFAVITGHEDPAKNTSSINWKQLATAVDTLVFLMGRQNLSHIVAKLTEHGRPASTPVAVIKDGTRPGQKTVMGTLADIVSRVEAENLRPPVVILVGEVAGLREKLRWFDNRPLFGKRVLVTRARHQASSLSRLLAERGAVPIELPAIKIGAGDNAALEEAIRNISQYDWVLFTSVNGVAAFSNKIACLDRDLRILHSAKIGAIGPATAAALAGMGIRPDYVPEVYTSEGIIAGLKKYELAGRRFLLPRADIADKELIRGLTGLGARVTDVAAYHTAPAGDSVARAAGLISAHGIDVITFTSSSTVTNLAAALGEGVASLNGIKVACIGPKTAETAARLGFRVDILAAESTIPGLVNAMEDYFRRGA